MSRDSEAVAGASGARRGAEIALRSVAILALAYALLLAWRREDGRPEAIRRLSLSEAAWSDSTGALIGRALTQELLSAARDSAARTLRVTVPHVPPTRSRALLQTLSGARVRVEWIDRSGASGLALSAERVADPNGAIQVRAALPRRGALVLRDAGGTLDSLVSERNQSPANKKAKSARALNAQTAGWRLGSVATPLQALSNKSTAATAVTGKATSRRVMLMALPGWEGKFVAAALEESGWSVDGRYRISPRASVTVGAPQRLDTARYAAVVVLDSMAVDASALARFVRQGGGLVLSGDALRIPTLAALRPARVNGMRAAVAGALMTDAPRRGLEAWALIPDIGAQLLRSEAGDRGREDAPVIAKRVGAGRVIASAYRNSWRWRMEGTDEGAAQHRQWWNTVVAAVVGSSTTPSVTVFDAYPGVAAPYADFVARVGAPDETIVDDAGDAGDAQFRATGDRSLSVKPIAQTLWHASPGLLFLLIATGLLGEWASRRFRGVR